MFPDVPWFRPTEFIQRAFAMISARSAASSRFKSRPTIGFRSECTLATARASGAEAAAASRAHIRDQNSLKDTEWLIGINVHSRQRMMLASAIGDSAEGGG
jgi:hypothetical protein